MYRWLNHQADYVEDFSPVRHLKKTWRHEWLLPCLSQSPSGSQTETSGQFEDVNLSNVICEYSKSFGILSPLPCLWDQTAFSCPDHLLTSSMSSTGVIMSSVPTVKNHAIHLKIRRGTKMSNDNKWALDLETTAHTFAVDVCAADGSEWIFLHPGLASVCHTGRLIWCMQSFITRLDETCLVAQREAFWPCWFSDRGTTSETSEGRHQCWVCTPTRL